MFSFSQKILFLAWMTLQIYFWIIVLITTTFLMTKELLLRILLCERKHMSLKTTEDFLLLTVIRIFLFFCLTKFPPIGFLFLPN